MIGMRIWPGYKYILVVLLCLVFVRPVLADYSRPVPTTIRTGFYLNGSNTDHVIQQLGVVGSYYLTLPVDIYAEAMSNLSVTFRVFNGVSWLVPTDDTAFAPVVDQQGGVVYSISVPLTVSTSFDDRIHELSLCWEQLNWSGNTPTVDLICNAFRVYTDDGSLYELGYGVDYWLSEDLSLFTTLYYLDEFFFSDSSKTFYCTTYMIDVDTCDALIPVPGLGFFSPGPDGQLPFTPPDLPFNGVDYGSFNGLSGFGSTLNTSPSGGWSGWLDDAAQGIKSTVDRAFHDGLTWIVGAVVPNVAIDVTPLNILADYMYFFGVYISTVQAVIPIPLFKFMLDLALWGGNLVWMMMLYGFVRKTAL